MRGNSQNILYKKSFKKAGARLHKIKKMFSASCKTGNYKQALSLLKKYPELKDDENCLQEGAFALFKKWPQAESFYKNANEMQKEKILKELETTILKDDYRTYAGVPQILIKEDVKNKGPLQHHLYDVLQKEVGSGISLKASNCVKVLQSLLELDNKKALASIENILAAQNSVLFTTAETAINIFDYNEIIDQYNEYNYFSGKDRNNILKKATKDFYSCLQSEECSLPKLREVQEKFFKEGLFAFYQKEIRGFNNDQKWRYFTQKEISQNSDFTNKNLQEITRKIFETILYSSHEGLKELNKKITQENYRYYLHR